MELKGAITGLRLFANATKAWQPLLEALEFCEGLDKEIEERNNKKGITDKQILTQEARLRNLQTQFEEDKKRLETNILEKQNLAQENFDAFKNKADAEVRQLTAKIEMLQNQVREVEIQHKEFMENITKEQESAEKTLKRTKDKIVSAIKEAVGA